MFHKSKANLAINKESDCANVCCQNVIERRIKHTKSIVCGKLYDTEKSTLISLTQDGRLLFITAKGNYFSCGEEHSNYIVPEENKILNIHEFIYTDIRPETAEYAKENIGRYVPEKYIELFGEVEEA